jgi:alkanesulfonate monooxygenase SsuD/methylene tetrahydromethanopterin reductase-like flavin-dependent oxidoreductase (luciferase family)
MTPQAIARAARIADGFNPIAFSLSALRGMIGQFRAAALAAQRDPSTLLTVVRANVPITETRLDPRPFLGGSPEQVAADLEPLRDLGVDHVFFTNVLQPDFDLQARLLARLQAAAVDAVAA